MLLTVNDSIMVLFITFVPISLECLMMTLSFFNCGLIIENNFPPPGFILGFALLSSSNVISTAF